MKRKLLVAFTFVLIVLMLGIGNSCLRQDPQKPIASGDITDTVCSPQTAEVNKPGDEVTTTSTLKVITIVSEEKTPVPVLSIENFKEALLSNDNCVFPCVLGIEPGKSLDDTTGRDWFSIQSSVDDDLTYSTSNYGNFKGVSIEIHHENSKGSIYFAFEEKKDNESESYVDNIILGINQIDIRDERLGEWFFEGESAYDVIGYFTSANVLETFGKPSQIVVKIDQYKLPADPEFTGIATVGYFYKDYKFYVEYFFPLQITNNKLNLCPDYGFVNLLSWYSEDDLMSNFFTNTHIGNYRDINSYVEISDMLDMSAAKYFTFMVNNELKQCLSAGLK